MKKLFVVFILLQFSIFTFAQENSSFYKLLNIDVKISGYGSINSLSSNYAIASYSQIKTWTPYLGFEKISEPEFFSIAGYNREAKAAEKHWKIKNTTSLMSVILLGGGALLWIGNEVAYAAGIQGWEIYSILGPTSVIAAALGTIPTTIALSMGNWATAGQAQYVANEYNSKLKSTNNNDNKYSKKNTSDISCTNLNYEKQFISVIFYNYNMNLPFGIGYSRLSTKGFGWFCSINIRVPSLGEYESDYEQYNPNGEVTDGVGTYVARSEKTYSMLEPVIGLNYKLMNNTWITTGIGSNFITEYRLFDHYYDVYADPVDDYWDTRWISSEKSSMEINPRIGIDYIISLLYISGDFIYNNLENASFEVSVGYAF